MSLSYLYHSPGEKRWRGIFPPMGWPAFVSHYPKHSEKATALMLFQSFLSWVLEMKWITEKLTRAREGLHFLIKVRSLDMLSSLILLLA